MLQTSYQHDNTFVRPAQGYQLASPPAVYRVALPTGTINLWCPSESTVSQDRDLQHHFDRGNNQRQGAWNGVSPGLRTVTWYITGTG